MPTITIDISKCTGCGNCVDVCPSEIYGLVEEAGVKHAKVVGDPDECSECEACLADCEGDAITIES